jgi:hypothetical protein
MAKKSINQKRSIRKNIGEIVDGMKIKDLAVLSDQALAEDENAYVDVTTERGYYGEIDIQTYRIVTKRIETDEEYSKRLEREKNAALEKERKELERKKKLAEKEQKLRDKQVQQEREEYERLKKKFEGG